MDTRSQPSSPGPRSLWRSLEAAFYLTRPHIVFSKVPISAAAWAVGRGSVSTSPVEAALLLLLLAAMQGLMFVLNDIHDAVRDRITAPYLPIPSGRVTRVGAMAEAAVLAGLFTGASYILADDLMTFAVVLITIPFAFATLAFYSRTKASWFSPLLGSLASNSFAAWAWLLAGHRQPWAFALLFAIASLHGVHNNLRSQIYDIEGDPKAGTMTLASRLGPKGALRIAATVRVIELTGIAIMVWLYGVPLGALWLVPAVALLIVAIARLPQAYATTRDRRAQTDALFIWVHVSFVTELATFGAFRPLLSLLLGAFMYGWFNGVRPIYYRRLRGTAPAQTPAVVV